MQVDLRDTGSIPESGRCPGEGNGNPLQDSCLDNPIDRGAWWATVHGIATVRRRMNTFAFTLNTNVRPKTDRGKKKVGRKGRKGDEEERLWSWSSRRGTVEGARRLAHGG